VAVKKKSRTSPAAAIFWLVFFIGVTGVFLFNRETIKKNFNLLTQRLKPPAAEAPVQDKPAETASEPAAKKPPSAAQGSPTAQGGAVEADKPAPAPQPAAQTTPQKPGPAQQTTPAAEKSAPEKPPAPQTAPAAKPAAPKPPETRERNIYFTQVDKDGQILRVKTSRKITVSDSPMQDALNALLAGPSADEKRRGMVSLVPANTRILSTTVRGSTAYISFSEEFQYNTYGVEGYAGQLAQIVWTATEFPNINDVQVLIEGRRVDYLGEGIWIGSPIGREGL
jgi:spore germination protein GerM